MTLSHPRAGRPQRAHDHRPEAAAIAARRPAGLARALASAALLLACAIGARAGAHAQEAPPEPGPGGGTATATATPLAAPAGDAPPGQSPPEATPTAAPPAAPGPPAGDATTMPPIDPAASPTPYVDPAPLYRDRLLSEINALRARAGLPPLAPAPAPAHDALDAYLADLAPAVAATGRCQAEVPGLVAGAWDYVAAWGYGAEPRGQLLVCPSEAYWTPEVVVAGWIAPGLGEYLADPDADTLACGLHGPRPDGPPAYRSVSCLTYDLE